jgi:predicted transcriptional regulator
VYLLAWDIDNDLKKSYRGRLEIVRDILLTAEKAGDSGSKKTHIMYGANLSYRLLERYLHEVLSAGLVYECKSCYVITNRGKEFLQVYGEYEKEHGEIEKHTAKLINGKEELENMLVLE